MYSSRLISSSYVSGLSATVAGAWRASATRVLNAAAHGGGDAVGVQDGHALGEGGDQDALLPLLPFAELGQEVVHLALHRSPLSARSASSGPPPEDECGVAPGVACGPVPGITFYSTS